MSKIAREDRVVKATTASDMYETCSVIYARPVYEHCKVLRRGGVLNERVASCIVRIQDGNLSPFWFTD